MDPLGEAARGGISVSVSTLDVLDGTDVSEAAGGYGIGVRAGSDVVTFSDGDLAAPVSVTVAAASANVKVDLAGAGEILSSVTAALGSGAKTGQLAYRIVDMDMALDVTGTIDDKTVIDGDINGDRVADFQIQLNGIIKLALTDFVL